jgi:hypothetical protein
MKIRLSKTYWDEFLQRFDQPANASNSLIDRVIHFVFVLVVAYFLVVFGIIALICRFLLLCRSVFSKEK